MTKVKTTPHPVKPNEEGDLVDLSVVLEDSTRKLSPARYPDLETGQTLRHGWVHVPIDMVVQLRSEKASPRTEGHLPFVGMDDIETDGLTIAQTRPFAEIARQRKSNLTFRQKPWGRWRPLVGRPEPEGLAGFDVSRPSSRQATLHGVVFDILI